MSLNRELEWLLCRIQELRYLNPNYIQLRHASYAWLTSSKRGFEVKIRVNANITGRVTVIKEEHAKTRLPALLALMLTLPVCTDSARR